MIEKLNFKERHKKYCKRKFEDCSVCQKIANMPNAKEDKSNFLVKLPPSGKPKAQPNFLIASTERLWNLTTPEQREKALGACGNLEVNYEIKDVARCDWLHIPIWTLREKLVKNHIDFFLAGMSLKDWETFLKKHMILGKEKSYIKEEF